MVTAFSGTAGPEMQDDGATYDRAVMRRLGVRVPASADEAAAIDATDQGRPGHGLHADAAAISSPTVSDEAPTETASAVSVPATATTASPDAQATDAPGSEESEEQVEPGRPTSASGEPLSDAEVREVEQLQDRDREVRAHEQAHKVAAGSYGGAIHYDYQRGPDNNNYAVGGHVPIDMSEVSGDPQATVQKMQTIRRAALAPAEPSSQDRAVAAQAAQKEAEARQQVRAEQAEEMSQTVVGEQTDAPTLATDAESAHPVSPVTQTSLASPAEGSEARASRLRASVLRAYA